MGSDPSVQEHLGDLYQKTGRLKLAAAHGSAPWVEMDKTVAAEVDTDARPGSAEAGRRESPAGQETVGKTAVRRM